MANKEIIKNTTDFFKEVDMSESDVLIQIQTQKERSREFVRAKRKEFEYDERLFNNQKSNPELIGDTTLFNVHTSLMARSFSDKINVNFKWGTGEQQKLKMLQKIYNEDFDIPQMKMVKYMKDHDKFLFWVWIVARTWWDWIYKRNKFQTVDPKTWYPDLNWDYITGNYSYTGFDKLAYMDDMEKIGYMNLKELNQASWTDWIEEQKEDVQENLWYEWEKQEDTQYNWSYEIYLHFAIFNWVKGWVLTGNNEQLVLSAWIVKAWNKCEEEDKSLIRFPFTFYYRKPRRYDPFGFRVADYVRDVQVNKSKIANLRFDKMKAELYPMYLYNSDYVSWKDLWFWFNKYIPFKTWIDWAINPNNIVSPLVPNTRMDASITIDQTLDTQVEKSTSIWAIVQWTTTEWRETLWTNQLVQSNTDINLSLNTKLDNISEENLAMEWIKGYYINFTSADSKIIYASSGFMEMPLVIKKKDFFIEWNFKIEIETSTESEARKNKQRLAFNQTVPLILQDPWVPEVSKRRALRRVWEINDIKQEQIEEELPKTVDEVIQEQENMLLADWIYIDINPDDDDLAHLVCVEAVTNTTEWMMHKQAHLMAFVKKWKPQPVAQEQWWMLNQMASQWMAQVGAESSMASRQPQLSTPL